MNGCGNLPNHSVLSFVFCYNHLEDLNHQMNSKYFGLAQMAGGFATSLKEKCVCMPVDWCCVGFSNVTTGAVIDGSYDLWLQKEQTSCLNKYEQKPLVDDIDFNNLNKRSMNNQSVSYSSQGYYSPHGIDDDDDDDDDDDTEDTPFLNSYMYFSQSDVSTPNSSKSRVYRMGLGVCRGLKGISRKLRKDTSRLQKTWQVPDANTLQESASEYPSQELSRSHFLFPLKEESSKSRAIEDDSIDSLIAASELL